MKNKSAVALSLHLYHLIGSIQPAEKQGQGMRCRITAVAVALLLLLCNSSFAQTVSGKNSVVIPPSSVQHPEDLGRRAHTNILILKPENDFKQVQSNAYGPPYSGYFYETPASLACLYQIVPQVTGCNPNTVTKNVTGGTNAIAIVDAYDDPNSLNDLTYFSTQFGLPHPNFQVVYANGVQPPNAYSNGWDIEESLDIEWAHAMAPGAKIYLVEAASNSYSDLLQAVEVATTLVEAAGGGEVSMSWGGGEWPGETSYDSYFTGTGVVYFASTGDWSGTIYPSVSPNVVAAGGTTVRRNPTTGNFISEMAWVSTGGGLSPYESIPSYQNGISSIVGTARGVPDISAVADPATGVWVYDSNGPDGGWYIVGGTSVSSPVLAGIVNKAGHFYSNTLTELTTVYANMPPAVKTSFRDIQGAYCGPYMGYSALTGWDFCSGVGSPKGLTGK